MAQRTCSIEGCDGQAWARGWCNPHYARWRRHGDPLSTGSPRRRPVCAIAGCDAPSRGLGYCNAHYLRQRRYGDPLGAAPQRERRLCTVPGCEGEHQGRGLCDMHLQRLRNHGDVNHVRRPPEDAYRKYTLNTSFFDEITTEEQAYWLGFITADGCVTQTKTESTLRVVLAIKDTGHLERMNADLGSSRPLAFRINGYNDSVVAAFASWQLVRALRRLGIHPHKSGTVEPWNGPEGLMPHYWRGLFDGDGFIYRSPAHANWHLGIVGSESCVRAFAAWAKQICGSTGMPRVHAGRTWGWRVGGSQKPQVLAEALYRDATVYLDRKQELATELLSISFPKGTLITS